MGKDEVRKVSFLIPMQTYKNLEKISKKNLISPSEQIRRFIDKGLSIEKAKQDEDIIRTYIRLELEPIIEKYMNRLISISVKGSSTSASSMILLAKTLECFIAPHLQEEFNETFNMSRKAGLEYVRLRDGDIEDFIDRT